MALDTNVVGALSGTGADVNASRQLKVVTETDAATNPGNVGGFRAFSEVDAGSETGTALLLSGEVSGDYRQRVGLDTLLFQDAFVSGNQNTNTWAHAFATMTCTQPATGFVRFGNVQGTTSAHGAMLRTYQYMPLYGSSALWFECRAGIATAALAANEVVSFGFGLPGSAILVPTDGIWFQLTTAGLIGRVCNTGVFTDSGVLVAFGDFVTGNYYKFLIRLSKEEVQWWADMGNGPVLLGTTPRPAGNAAPCLQGALPVFAQRHNTGNVSNTAIFNFGEVFVTAADLHTSKPWAQQQASSAGSSLIAQNGATPGKTTWWTNNTAPTAAAATNTAAIAGATTLGGLVAVLPTLTANNDGILFTYTVPASAANITGKNLVVTGVKVQGAVSVVLVGGPVVYAYAVAFGHTADSLATPETGSFATATTHAPRMAFIGMETYPVTAAAGTLGAGCTLDLSNGPIVVRPGERIALVGRNIGTVTSSGAITIGCTFIGYWE